MDAYDFVIIGAGPAGEAAAYKARELGASVAIADRRWFGGSCPHIGCVPSKALLHAARRHLDEPGYDWPAASARRDYMVNRPADAAEPDDGSHVRALEGAGAAVDPGHRPDRRPGPGRDPRRRGRPGGRRPGDPRRRSARASKVPPVAGLEAVRTWTNREATLARELPRSLLVLGGGPTGCELAQVYARFGVPTTIVQSGPRLVPTDHPRNAATIEATLRRDGVTIRTGVRAVRARAGAGADGGDVIELDDGSTAEGHAVLLAVGRTIPFDDLGLELYGLEPTGRPGIPRDGRLRLAEGLWTIGDAAGPELHTHQGHYQGELAVRMALGESIEPDYRALPRATYTDPEAASVGVTLDQALAAGHDAFECWTEFATTAKGYSVEADLGHVTIVVDRASGRLLGAAMACPDASAAIHECVLAIKADVPIGVLAETIHAFPSTSRIFNGLFAEAARRLRTGT